MTADTLRTRRLLRRMAVAAGAVGLFALIGCKSDKDAPGSNTGGIRDPLVYGPARIPKQDLPVPDRGYGKNGRDILTTPTGSGGKAAGYNDDPERFKGTYIPGEWTTPAALAGRIRDGEELKIESPGVPLLPASGSDAAVPDFADAVSPLFAQLEKYGVMRDDRKLEREGGKYVFRASVPISGNGARREFTGVGVSAGEAVKQVLDQVVANRN